MLPLAVSHPRATTAAQLYNMRRIAWIPWRWWRRAAQFALLVLFLWLFRRTEYIVDPQTGAVVPLTGSEHLFFHLDPLVNAVAVLASRTLTETLLPALAVVILTMLFGRFFCGWVCPLGTLLDYFHRLLRPITRRTNSWFDSPATNSRRLTAAGSRRIWLRSTRYILLIVVLSSAVFSFSLVGLVDPFALLTRGLTFWGDPTLFRGADAAFGWLDGRWGSAAVQSFATDHHLLPFRATVFHLAGVSAAILAVIFALEFVARRFWCRYLCPLGAMLGLLGRWSLVKRLPAGTCKTCGHCAELCRMDALGDGLSVENCTLCMDCVDLCPKGIAKFTVKIKPTAKKPTKMGATAGLSSSEQLGTSPRTAGQASSGTQQITAGQTSSGTRRRPRPVDLSRRGALVGLALGAGIPGVAAAARAVRPREVDPYLLRPPGAGDEKTFLDLCVRCGECMKVCPSGVLQPAVLESGVAGIFSPRLIPRLVFEQTNCEYTCTLCGQVCPTGAIPRLSEAAKHKRPMGKAYFDHARCLPWAKKTPCVRCEEMCPVPDKAIKILNTFTVKDADGFEVELQQPYVDRDLCVGCGICESNCPLEPVDEPAAIRVRRIGAPDPKTEFLLKGKPGAVRKE